MRNLFLALVLANLGFAAWQQWFAPRPAINPTANPDQPTILLASELDDRVVLVPQPVGTDPALLPELPENPRDAALAAAAGTLDQAAVTEPVGTIEPDVSVGDAQADGDTDTERAERERSAPAANLACISIGPFRELAQVTAAAAYLRSDGLDPVQRAGEGDIWVGFWVYLEQLPGVAEAEQILARLRENGISDSYVIPSSDSGTLISLGVFTEIARASNRLLQVGELGYEATISDRTRRGTVYWVDVWLEPGHLLDFEQLQPPGRIVRLEQKACNDG
jgi:hypothetical protein